MIKRVEEKKREVEKKKKERGRIWRSVKSNE